MLRKIVFIIVVFVLLIPAASFAQDDMELPEEVIIERPGFTPEGIEWDAERGRFLVGSIVEGSIFEVMDDGTHAAFIEDEDLVSSIGIEIDPINDRLLVANSNAAVFADPTAGIAMLGAYDLETGERLFMADLTAVTPDSTYFANDVAVDEKGNAYITNSFAPIIWKVDMEGNASVFVEDERLISEGFGMNGIVYHAHLFLLVAVAGTGEIYKIPLDDPAGMSLVELGQPISADGMVILSDGHLVVVDAASASVLEIMSEDEWASGTVIAASSGHENATTAAVRDDEVYVVNAYFDDPERETYDIVHVIFEAME
ncbi:MAG TPA: hypothetical protein VJZ27_20735 [Aggregatilineales bacterium]|nr:hypothetical protein [Aggregatilineales bacterium]